MTTMRRIRPKLPPIYIDRPPFGSIEDPWTAPASCWNNDHQLRAPQARNTTRVLLRAASRHSRCRRRQGRDTRENLRSPRRLSRLRRRAQRSASACVAPRRPMCPGTHSSCAPCARCLSSSAFSLLAESLAPMGVQGLRPDLSNSWTSRHWRCGPFSASSPPRFGVETSTTRSTAGCKSAGRPDVEPALDTDWTVPCRNSQHAGAVWSCSGGTDSRRCSNA